VKGRKPKTTFSFVRGGRGYSGSGAIPVISGKKISKCYLTH